MLWAVLVMLMVALISTGIIIISRIYYLREQDENYQVQAQLYAESAIDLIQSDIVSGSDTYLSDSNNSQTVTVTFPDASNWTCYVTISHSVVDTSSGTPENSGIIYLTAKVWRSTTSGSEKELSEVCAKMEYTSSSGWKFVGYYNL